MIDPNQSQLKMIIHIESNLKDLIKNRLEVSNNLNKQILTDFHFTENKVDLMPIEMMLGSINEIPGSIELLKFESDSAFEGNSFTFAL